MKSTALVLVLSVIVACSTSGSPSSEVRDEDTIQGVGIVARGNLERPGPGAQTLRSREQLEEVLSEMGQMELVRRGPLSDVSFDSQVVVVAYLGRRRTGGYSLEISAVEREGDFVTIQLAETAPLPDEAQTQALTWPAVLVLVDDAPPGVRAFIRN